MNMYDIIETKRDGGALTESEIRYFVEGAVDGSVPDYQITALLMAIYFRGMSERETFDLTVAMAESGEMLDLSPLGGNTCDKHSTGGVGDKVSLVLIPLLASLGRTSVKMSGRGLGHTGGTVDKLESIPGCRTAFSSQEMMEIAARTGGIIAGQTERIAPADKVLYALRDVTGTVNSIPLIASSVMSKKLAGGNHSILLDVKFGSGAFMKTKELAEKLAGQMMEIGKRAGRKMIAVLTNMDQPLGVAVGNVLEVQEAIRVLHGESGAVREEVANAAALLMSLDAMNREDALRMAYEYLDNGKAFEKFVEIMCAQGAERDNLLHPEKLKVGKYCTEVRSEASGYLSVMDTEALGRVAQRLGAGREKKEDAIDPGAGFILKKKLGDWVEKGEVLATLYTEKEAVLSDECEAYRNAVHLSETKPEPHKLIEKIIE